MKSKLPDVGLCGPPRIGKDTAAYALRTIRGYDRIAFADLIKQKLCVLLDATIVELERHKERLRPLMQLYGEIKRSMDPDFFVRPVLERIHQNRQRNVPTVVPDVRYRNEADALRNEGVIVLSIHPVAWKEPLIGQRHPSEQLWRGPYPFDGTLQSIYGQPEHLVEELFAFLDYKMGVPRSDIEEVERTVRDYWNSSRELT